MSESIREIVEKWHGTSGCCCLGNECRTCSEEQKAIIEALEAREAAMDARVVEIIHNATAQYAAEASKAMGERDGALRDLASALAHLSVIPDFDRECAKRILRALAAAREYVSCDKAWSGEAKRLYEDIGAIEAPMREMHRVHEDATKERDEARALAVKIADYVLKCNADTEAIEHDGDWVELYVREVHATKAMLAALEVFSKESWAK